MFLSSKSFFYQVFLLLCKNYIYVFKKYFSIPWKWYLILCNITSASLILSLWYKDGILKLRLRVMEKRPLETAVLLI